MNVTHVTNVYNRTVVVNNVHTSFNGAGGIEARPTREEESYSHESHTPALAAQTEHEHAASQNKQLFASENHGRPAVAATARPGEFSGHNVERAKAAGEPYRAPKISPKEARASSEGNRGSNESGRNGGNSGRNSEMRNNESGNRGQMASRENSNATKQERAMQQKDRQSQKQKQQAQKQAQAEQKRTEKANRAQAKAEQKRNAREQRR